MKVNILNIFGNDDMIVDVARVSYGKTSELYTEEQNKKLLKYLWKNKHTSPFRHPQIQFRISCPIYVERQLFKHQIGVSVNSISGRYVDFSDTYTTIGEWRKQSKNSKQGSEGFIEDQKKADFIELNIIDTCKKAYKELIDLGVSKEQARSVLPLSLNTEFIWTGSLLAFLHLCSLRLKKDTQEETRKVVEAMLEQLLKSGKFNNTIEIYNNNSNENM